MLIKQELFSSIFKLISTSRQSLLKPIAISRSIHTTQANNLKKIEKTEDKTTKSTIIEGKYLDSESVFQTKVIKFDANAQSSAQDSEHQIKPCAFCELEKRDIYVQHTDVLILRQFLKEDGVALPRKITGLCKKQHRKLLVLAKHARLAGLILNLQPNLLDGSTPLSDPRKRPEYLKWNHYFDDYETMKKQFKYL